MRVAPGETTETGQVLVPAPGRSPIRTWGRSLVLETSSLARAERTGSSRGARDAGAGRTGAPLRASSWPRPGELNNAVEGQGGEWWVGTTAGLLRYSPRRARALTRANGLASAYTFTTLADRAGQVWIGTWGGGLHRVRPIAGQPAHAERIEGAPTHVRTLLQDTQGRIWAGGMRDVAVLREGRVVRTMQVQGADRLAQLRDGSVLNAGGFTPLVSRDCAGQVRCSGGQLAQYRLCPGAARGPARAALALRRSGPDGAPAGADGVAARARRLRRP